MDCIDSSHLFYFLENDKGPSSIPLSLPPHFTPLESPLDAHKGYNLVATLQRHNSGSLPDKLGAIKPLNKRQVQSHTDKSLLSDRDGEIGRIKPFISLDTACQALAISVPPVPLPDPVLFQVPNYQMTWLWHYNITQT